MVFERIYGNLIVKSLQKDEFFTWSGSDNLYLFP
jgi:hypothetical protein